MKAAFLVELDGGGMKGIFSAYFMKMFCNAAGIKGEEIWKHVDFISGSSIGAIMGCAYANGQSPDFLINFFKEYGPQIFTSASGTPMKALQKTIAFTSFSVAGGLNFVSGESFYGAGTKGSDRNEVLDTQLIKVFGTTKMFQSKTNVIITSVERIPVPNGEELNYNYRPVLFSNIKLSGLEGQNYLISEAVQASGAAPFYLPPITIKGAPVGRVYLDGGIGINNAAGLQLAYNTAIDDSDRINLLSVGCGQGTTGFYHPADAVKSSLGVYLNVSDNIEYLKQVLDIAGTSAQEATALQMKLFSTFGTRINDADFNYYRFNTVYDTTKNTELDNSGNEFCNYLETAATEQFNRDKIKIEAFINKL